MLPHPSPLLLGPVPGVVLWTPSQLSSRKAQYDASLLTGVDGNRKTTWPDQTGSFDATAGGVGAVLKTGANGLNGLNVLRFAAAVNEYYTISSSLLNGATAGSFFAVVKQSFDPASSTTHAGAWLDAFTNDTGASKSSEHVYSDGNIYEHFGRATGRLTVNPTPSMTSWRIYSCHMSAAGAQTMYLDGTSIGTAASLTVNFGNVTRQIGRDQSNASFLDGFIAEEVVYNSDLSTSDRQKTEGYLAWKWGLQASLPGGHPYASAAPTV